MTGDAATEIDELWAALASVAVLIPTECPHCHLPVLAERRQARLRRVIDFLRHRPAGTAPGDGVAYREG